MKQRKKYNYIIFNGVEMLGFTTLSNVAKYYNWDKAYLYRRYFPLKTEAGELFKVKMIDVI